MNSKVLIPLLLSLCISLPLSAQTDGSFTMAISSDTVLFGNTFSLSYSIENLEGEFRAPDLSGFRIVAGPNVTSQYSSVNGRVTQNSSYSYYLMPRELGIVTIGTAKLESEEGVIELDPIEINVLDNPHGIEENFGSPLMRRQQIANQDTLTDKQKVLLEKLKKGKKKKI